MCIQMICVYYLHVSMYVCVCKYVYNLYSCMICTYVCVDLYMCTHVFCDLCDLYEHKYVCMYILYDMYYMHV
jgi:hypothetical protein